MAKRQWIVTPTTIGERTRYKVQRADGSETRGVWDLHSLAQNLADLLNKEEEEVWFDDPAYERELLHI